MVLLLVGGFFGFVDEGRVDDRRVESLLVTVFGGEPDTPG